MKTEHIVIGVLAAVVVGAVGWKTYRHYHPKAPQLTEGGGGVAQSDVAKWHVAAVTSGYGKTVFPSAPATPPVLRQGDYVTFALVYDKTPNDVAKNPVAVAIGQVNFLTAPTNTGKQTAVVRFVREINWNSNYDSALAVPPRDTLYSVTSDDIAAVVSAADVEKYLGTA